MTLVGKLIQRLSPGDYVDLDAIESEHGSEVKHQFLDEFEGQGFVLNGDSVVGEVEICVDCDGDGMSKDGRTSCRVCDGYSMTVDHGRGKRPFRQ